MPLLLQGAWITQAILLKPTLGARGGAQQLCHGINNREI